MLVFFSLLSCSKDAIELALRNREELADFRRLVDAANDIGSTAKPTGAYTLLTHVCTRYGNA